MRMSQLAKNLNLKLRIWVYKLVNSINGKCQDMKLRVKFIVKVESFQFQKAIDNPVHHFSLKNTSFTLCKTCIHKLQQEKVNN